ncbi:hypothetical protein [Bradyrhizobium sp. C9]|uniref:hypothetical protein n=1 Tax=Bradyrhizobium sp. C9 TaxID=142585 RepID=UPI000BEAB833|nr:hypothetical protein [Bradyrhizobium sp. C9]PDT74952.1 hypothetical protein CO675_21835 [Bradyrhizobium sp. C9]
MAKAIVDEAAEMARLVNIDLSSIKGSTALSLAINKMVIAEVVMQYTLIDEMLAEIIVRYFFNIDADVLHFEQAWNTDKFRIFVHHVLDETFLLKKLSIVQAISPVPSEITKIINRINAVRNGFAHSFFPENRKENRGSGNVLYGGADIRSLDGMRQFKGEADQAYRYLYDRVYAPEPGA